MELNQHAITDPSSSDALVERRVLDVAMLIYRGWRVEYGELLGRPIARLVKDTGVRRRELGTLSVALARDAEALLHRFDPESYPAPHTQPTAT